MGPAGVARVPVVLLHCPVTGSWFCPPWDGTGRGLQEEGARQPIKGRARVWDTPWSSAWVVGSSAVPALVPSGNRSWGLCSVTSGKPRCAGVFLGRPQLPCGVFPWPGRPVPLSRWIRDQVAACCGGAEGLPYSTWPFGDPGSFRFAVPPLRGPQCVFSHAGERAMLA